MMGEACTLVLFIVIVNHKLLIAIVSIHVYYSIAGSTVTSAAAAPVLVPLILHLLFLSFHLLLFLLIILGSTSPFCGCGRRQWLYLRLPVSVYSHHRSSPGAAQPLLSLNSSANFDELAIENVSHQFAWDWGEPLTEHKGLVYPVLFPPAATACHSTGHM